MQFNQEDLAALNPPALEDWAVSSKVIKITTLGENEKPYRCASGFIINNHGDIYLYTCWHVVTGISQLKPEFKVPPIPKFIKISGYNVSKAPEYFHNTRKKIDVKTGDIVTIGSSKEFTFPLYDSDGKPLWEQQKGCEQENSDLEAINIKIPYTDVVRLKIQLPEEISALWALDSRHLEYMCRPKMWDTVFIIGFPYGYSATTESCPTPIALRRMIASWATGNADKTLLDGAGVRGMSGGPIYSEDKKLIGIYQGKLYADYNSFESEKRRVPNDENSALGYMTEYYCIGMMFGDLFFDTDKFTFKFRS